MVDALSRARQWLAPPAGRVIDLRPAEVIPIVEVGLADGAVVSVGPLRVEEERRARHQAADEAVRTVVARGLLTATEEQRFPFYRYADSADELRDHIAAKWRHTRMDAPTHRKALEVLRAHPDGRLWLREQAVIRVLRPPYS